jgi:hypothetical protein
MQKDDQQQKVEQPSMQNTQTGSKKCIVCHYEGEEVVCPQCGMLLEDKCPNCDQCKVVCVCKYLNNSTT